MSLRYFNVFGRRQDPNGAYAAVIPKFLDAALHGRPLQIHGDGTQSRDFTYVDTVCAVIHRSIVGQVHSVDPVNLAYGTNTHLLELVQMIEDRLGHPVEREFTAARVGDVKASQADNGRVRELFPTVDPVPLHDGLAATIDWFRSELGDGHR